MHPDVAVIGAGSFGAWTAWHLHRAGLRVRLYDAYGPANSRASSGGESRIIRMGYGPREIYTRWSVRSMELWRAFIDSNDPSLFHNCGAMWLAQGEDPFAMDTMETLARCGVTYERLPAEELRRRFPQFRFDEAEWAVYEPGAGALMARRVIQTLVRSMIAAGVHYEQRLVRPGEVEAGAFVFACGPWLPKLFPEILERRIVTSRQEVLFFGVPASDKAFGPENTPCWIDVSSQIYGLPDLENRGFKFANDLRGPEIDPDTAERHVAQTSVDAARHYLGRRVPALANAPLVEARVCQYENTATGDYLLDRHPDRDNVWLAGGGSGHGFKHGPAVGEYLCNQILGRGDADPRFALAAKLEMRGASGSSF